MSKNKVTITIDMDALREHIRKEAKENNGLENSSGVTPVDLDFAFDNSDTWFGPEGESLRVVFRNVITMMCDAHDEFKKDEEEGDTEEEDENGPFGTRSGDE